MAEEIFICDGFRQFRHLGGMRARGRGAEEGKGDRKGGEYPDAIYVEQDLLGCEQGGLHSNYQQVHHQMADPVNRLDAPQEYAPAPCLQAHYSSDFSALLFCRWIRQLNKQVGWVLPRHRYSL